MLLRKKPRRKHAILVSDLIEAAARGRWR
jgi:hypothetical protein